MIEVYKRDAHFLSHSFEVVMVEQTHFPALVLTLPEILFLGIFECSLEE